MVYIKFLVWALFNPFHGCTYFMKDANIYIKKLHQSSMKTVTKVISLYQTIQYHPLPLSYTCTNLKQVLGNAYQTKG